TRDFGCGRAVPEPSALSPTPSTGNNGRDRRAIMAGSLRRRGPSAAKGDWRRHPDSDPGVRGLQTLALPLGYAAIQLSANGLARRRFVAGYSAGYYFQAHHLSLDHRIRDAAIALRRRDRRVTPATVEGRRDYRPCPPTSKRTCAAACARGPLDARAQ